MTDDDKRTPEPAWYSRFDVPAPVARFLELAIDAQLVDVRDIMALTLTFGAEWGLIVDEVTEWAWAGRHGKGGQARHAAILRAAYATRTPPAATD